MRVGHAHNWRYHGHMKEKKFPRGNWRFFWKQRKYRAGRGFKSGAPLGTTYKWRINAIQQMRKVSPNSYSGYMKGLKRFISRY